MARGSRPDRTALAPAEATLFRGYGPLVALVVLILAMALLAPTIAPERDVVTGSPPASPDSSWRSSLTPLVMTPLVTQERRVAPGGGSRGEGRQ